MKALLLTAALASAAAPPPGRVVVLGFDGVDAAVTKQMLDAGRLPNLAELARRGGFSPLTPTVPAQTPVSWATFTTGLDPGGHRIFDFLKRNPADLIPTFAVAEETTAPLGLGKANPFAAGGALLLIFGLFTWILARGGKSFARRLLTGLCAALGLSLAIGAFVAVRRWVPSERPAVVNNRQGTPFWTVHGARPATVVRMPVTFPPDPFEQGHLLAGLGVPDISGRIGRPSFFTSDPFFTPRQGNDFSIELVRLETNIGRQVTRIAGPPGRPFGREGWIETPMVLIVPDTRDKLEVEIGATRVTLAPGAWSDWVDVSFRVNPIIQVHGYVRLRLAKVNPEIELYVSPVQFDPQRLPPGLALSSPKGWAAELVSQVGRYKTMGWGLDTWSVQSGTLPEEAFLEDLADTVATERKMLALLLAEKRRLLFHYFEYTDRIGHLFWRLRDPQHPAYDAALAARFGDAVEKSYETMDAIVGDTMKTLAPEDVLIVLSDHGFATWRRSVNYNTWLVDKGYLVLSGSAERKNLEVLFSRGKFWDSVDWSKTRAYSLGFGDIYVNLKGREHTGIVEPGLPYEALRDEIAQGLLELTDPKSNERVVSRVFKREEVYRRFDPRLIPDLIASNRAGWRVSWQSTLGVPTELFEDNKDVWSGDHCSLDPALVRGVLFSSRAFESDPLPGIADVTASIRRLLGEPADPEAAGKSLW
ncbi:MAG TPA: alkaline phosphatase family protein [Thermoanaerobaculia bacterium]